MLGGSANHTGAKTWTLMLAKKVFCFFTLKQCLAGQKPIIPIEPVAIDQPHCLLLTFWACTNAAALSWIKHHLFLLLSACLHEAIAGKSSGSKRKHASDEESEDWWQWSLKLGAENKILASVAKTNIEKAEKSGAHGFKFKGKGKKCCQSFQESQKHLEAGLARYVSDQNPN